MLRRPPRSTLFPYTTLFRSAPSVYKTSHTFVIPCARNGELSRLSGGCVLRISQSYVRSEEHTSELQSRRDLVCRLLLEKKKKKKKKNIKKKIKKKIKK